MPWQKYFYNGMGRKNITSMEVARTIQHTYRRSLIPAVAPRKIGVVACCGSGTVSLALSRQGCSSCPARDGSSANDEIGRIAFTKSDQNSKLVKHEKFSVTLLFSYYTILYY